MVKTIEVTISPTGEVKIETAGYAGAECETATAELEKALGVVGSRTAKPERFLTKNVNVQKVGAK